MNVRWVGTISSIKELNCSIQLLEIVRIDKHVIVNLSIEKMKSYIREKKHLNFVW